MTRRLAFALLLAGLFCSAAPSARAQYSYGNYRQGMMYNLPPGVGSFPYSFNYTQSLAYNIYNPVTGGYNRFSTYSSYTTPFPVGFNGYGGVGLGGYGLANNYLAGGVGSYSGMATPGGMNNPIAAEQVRLLRAAGRQNVGNGGAAQNMIADQWAYEQNAQRLAPAPAADPGPQAPDDQVLSGRALNELADAIDKLEAGGAKAAPPLFPANLLAAIEYTPSPASNLMSLLRGGQLQFPEPLNSLAARQPAADLLAAAQPVADAVQAGKKVEAAVSDRLAAQVKKARTDLAPTLRELPFDDATAASRYLSQLDNLAAAGKDARLAAAVVPKWASVGATASELVKHNRDQGLRFAPVAAGNEEAYFALYRGLAGYRQALATPRK